MSESLFPVDPTLCMCRACDGVEYVGWRPCPASLCERRSHLLIHRIATAGRDYRYGGLAAWLRWIVKGIADDEGNE